MSLWLRFVVGNVLHYTKMSCFILQLNRAETVAKMQCFSCFGTEVLQNSVYYFCCFLRKSELHCHCRAV